MVLVLGLVGLSALTFLITLFGALKISSLNSTNDFLGARIEKAERELADATRKLSQTQKHVEALIDGRLPYLLRLEFDKVMPLNQSVAKNILFTLIKKSEKNRYEYKIVLQNDNNWMSIPEIKVLLFSRFGINLGVDKIPKLQPLLRDESSSYSGFIDLVVPDEPYYFYVSIKHSNGQVLPN